MKKSFFAMPIILTGIAMFGVSISFAQSETNSVSTGEIEMPPPADLATLGFETRPKEIGTVAWTRDWESAQKISRETGRPLFVLFQEVPG